MKATTLIIASALVALATTTHAQLTPVTLSGNGNTGFGGPVGNGNLVISNSPSTITFSLNSASSLGGNDLVLYLDSVPGGFSSTAGFNDAGDGGRSAVSGYTATGNGGGPGQSVLTFASGFAPNYAIDFGNSFAGLFGLANGGNNSLNFITGTAQSGSAPYTLTIPLSDLGITAGQSLEAFGTLVSETGYRSSEAIAGNDTGTQGWNPYTQTSFATITTVPEPTTLALLGISSVATMRLFRRRK